MNRLRVTLPGGGHADYTAQADGLTGYQVHPSGCLLVYSGVDQPARWVWSFGSWVTCEVDPDE